MNGEGSQQSGSLGTSSLSRERFVYRWVLSLEWKSKELMNYKSGENEDDELK